MIAWNPRANEIFLRAAEIDAPPERLALLDSVCAGDAELRRQVEALLMAHDSAGSFLDTPAGIEARGGETVTRAPDQGDEPGDGPELGFLDPPRVPGNLGRFFHYEVQSVVGSGGMGIVLKALDESLDRTVAIKVLNPQFAANAAARKRFTREAKAIAAVSHEHVVAVHAVGEGEPVPHIVMQFVGGVSLQERIDRGGPLELKEVLRIGMQIASGLAAAHAQGIVHRDIKPANILLENGVERVKITDFGLARAVDDASVTQSGVIAGTPLFMSPEQAAGEPVDHRSDLFSLGSVLYAMCTGHAPFRAGGTMAVLKRVIEDTPRPAREVNPEVPDWLDAIIGKLHAKDPAQRFQSAKEVAELLEQHLAHLQQPGNVPMPARVSPPPTTASDTAPPRKRSRVLPILMIVAPLVLVTLVMAAVSYFRAPFGTTRLLAPPLIILSAASLYAGIELLRRGGVPEPAQARVHPEPRPPKRKRWRWLVESPAPRRSGRRKWAIAAAVLVLTVGVIVAVITSLSPSRGTATVETRLVVVDVEELDGKEVRLRLAGTEFVFDRVGEHKIRLPVGTYQAEWVSPGKSVLRQTVHVFNEAQTKFTVRAWPVPPDADGWVPLFNGKDLSGWKVPAGNEKNWTVENGILAGVGHADQHANESGYDSLLWSERADYENFRFRIEAKINGDGEAGQLFGKPVGGISRQGYKVQIAPAGPDFRTGSLFKWTDREDLRIVAAIREVLVPSETWFVQEVIADGRRIIVKINGRTVVDVTEDKAGRPGRLGLSASHTNAKLRIRKIEVKELPATQPDVDRLQGAWQAVAVERIGKAPTPDEVRSIRFEFTGNKITSSHLQKGAPQSSVFTIDSTKDPKQITVKLAPDSTFSVEGIYRFDGDRLILCMPMFDIPKSRPTKFELDSADPARALMTFVRDGAAGTGPPPAVAPAPPLPGNGIQRLVWPRLIP